MKLEKDLISYIQRQSLSHRARLLGVAPPLYARASTVAWCLLSRIWTNLIPCNEVPVYVLEDFGLRERKTCRVALERIPEEEDHRLT